MKLIFEALRPCRRVVFLDNPSKRSPLLVAIVAVIVVVEVVYSSIILSKQTFIMIIGNTLNECE